MVVLGFLVSSFLLGGYCLDRHVREVERLVWEYQHQNMTYDTYSWLVHASALEYDACLVEFPAY